MTPDVYRTLAVRFGSSLINGEKTVPFRGDCPWCGSNDRRGQRPGLLFGSRSKYRVFVPERRWSFLWWKAYRAHFRVVCNGCGVTYRELPLSDSVDLLESLKEAR